MLCPVCGKKNVLGVDTCARCGGTLRIITERLSGYGSQVVDLGILEEDERRGEREERPGPHAQSSIYLNARREQETDR